MTFMRLNLILIDWEYSYSDYVFSNNDEGNETISFDSFMVAESD